MAKRNSSGKPSRQGSGQIQQISKSLLASCEADHYGKDANKYIKQLNSFASSVPKDHKWQFHTVEGLSSRRKATPSNIGNLNRVYWGDFINNYNAFLVASVWRTCDLLRSAAVLLNSGQTIPACIIARSALESSVLFLDTARKVSKTLKQISRQDLMKNVCVSEELELLSLKTVFGSRLADADEHQKPTNILTVLTRIGKIPRQGELGKHYEILSEVTHPNALGRDIYVQQVSNGKFDGEEIRHMKQATGQIAPYLLRSCIGAVAWSAGSQVSAGEVLNGSLNDMAQKCTPHLN